MEWWIKATRGAQTSELFKKFGWLHGWTSQIFWRAKGGWKRGCQGEQWFDQTKCGFSDEGWHARKGEGLDIENSARALQIGGRTKRRICSEDKKYANGSRKEGQVIGGYERWTHQEGQCLESSPSHEM